MEVKEKYSRFKNMNQGEMIRNSAIVEEDTMNCKFDQADEVGLCTINFYF